ncbi:MAG: glutaminase [Lysobacterales bacterium]
MHNYQAILQAIYDEAINATDKGSVATYIPELATVDVHQLGLSLRLSDGSEYSVGDYATPFSIQSISKVLALAKALSIGVRDIWTRVDVEPSGNPFNHLSLLELENGIPRNPLINSGAIVIADILVSQLDNPLTEFLEFVRQLTGDDEVGYNERVARSERDTGYKNFAAANLLKSFGNLENPVDEVLDFYFHQCSIEMSCQQLSKAFHLFSNRGTCAFDKAHITDSEAKRINAIMLTCGFYDEAGEFAFEVGLPGKSGVGGGILALLPNEYVIATWSPGLNAKGNSMLGMLALEQFTSRTKMSIF